MSQFKKLLIDFGPLALFYFANWKGGIYLATPVFMVAIAIALPVSWAMTRKISPMLLISAAFVLLFGGLTLYLHSDVFIKVKVTLINVLFGSVLLGGAVFGRNYLKLMMGEAMNLPEHAWRVLTIRWGIFFFGLAALNEVIWRSMSTDNWVNFKVFGLLPLTLLFAVANAPFMAKHMHDPEATPQ